MNQVMTGNYQHWSLNIDENNILWLTFDKNDSSANTLNESTLREFDQILNTIGQHQHVKALVIRSAKKSGFILGADITGLEAVTHSEQAAVLSKAGQDIFNKLEALTIPTIALIEGFCLGGGLELALACTYRIAEDSAKTRLGLPEVRLGVHPGWGGTVRLPKLIGAIKAMDLILSGRNLTAKSAKKMGVVNEALPKRLLHAAALSYALNPPENKKQFKFQDLTHNSFVRPLLGRLFTSQLNKKIKRQHYPAPFEVVDNWVETGVAIPAAYNKEAETFGKMIMTDTSRNLVRIFFLQEQLKSQGKNSDYKPTHVHVIGAGVMGGDVAAWCAIRGFKVTLQDQAPGLIGNAIKRCFDLATKQLKEKYLVQQVMDRLLPDPKGFGIKTADVIIEAITEKLNAKKDLFSKVEKEAKQDAILATNTSTIPLEEIATALEDPTRLVGIHFFNPVAKMPLVEIVKGEQTSNAVIENATVFVRKIDKLPLHVKSAPGFLVNRILLPYMLEAVALLEEGIEGPVIDKAAVQFGMPMGPIELADTVGLDICLAALEKLAASSNIKVPEKLREYVVRGDLGRKTGQGFYRYKKGKTIKPKIQSNGSIPSDITDRLMLRLLNEAVACLREGIVDSADHLDTGCIFGFGFPPFRGGPITYARTQGWETLLEQLEELSERYGNRFAPDKGWQSGAVA
ncbi:MAG: 3-hydroxyacyl-CoA dehydrogenase NAD-binding domain-containing protein [Candidatus Berkiella sp.]